MGFLTPFKFQAMKEEVGMHVGFPSPHRFLPRTVMLIKTKNKNEGQKDCAERRKWGKSQPANAAGC
jgi:hypothetical protein